MAVNNHGSFSLLTLFVITYVVWYNTHEQTRIGFSLGFHADRIGVQRESKSGALGLCADLSVHSFELRGTSCAACGRGERLCARHDTAGRASHTVFCKPRDHAQRAIIPDTQSETSGGACESGARELLVTFLSFRAEKNP